jgi:hypothetical protein
MAERSWAMLVIVEKSIDMILKLPARSIAPKGNPACLKSTFSADGFHIRGAAR